MAINKVNRNGPPGGPRRRDPRSWPESSLLGGLAPPAREILLSAGGQVHYEPGRVLMREADKTAFVLVLLHGMVKATSASRDGHDVLLAVRMGGDLIGEFSAVDGQPRSATVTACGPVVARMLNRYEFLDCMGRDPRIAQAVTASVVSQLRTANSYRVDFTGCDAATRVARVLCQFAKAYGRRVEDSTLIDWPITQLELASLCGAAEPTVHKALRALRKSGVISTGYRSITIQNLPELRRTAFE